MRAALLLALGWVGACGSEDVTPPPPANGTITVELDTTTPVAPAGFTLSSASLVLNQIQVLGDVAPNGNATIATSTVDMTMAKDTLSFVDVPQGLYSRVQFTVAAINFSATFTDSLTQHTRHLDAAIVPLAGVANLLDASGDSIDGTHPGTFLVTIDGGSWFGSGGTAITLPMGEPGDDDPVRIDGISNTTTGQKIAANVMASISLTP